jgi:Ca2+-binding EF-hand superfamily protein
VLGLAKNAAELKKIWAHLDGNGNGNVSLAELDLFVKSKWPLLAHAPALMRAFKATTHTTVVTSATCIKEHHLRALLENLFFFNKLNSVFDAIDSDGDHRLTFAEFMGGLKHVGLKLSAVQAKKFFQSMDANNGGFVLCVASVFAKHRSPR